MPTINFYLDKPDKKGFSPIHLRINCNGNQFKLATGEKVLPEHFNKERQLLNEKSLDHDTVNHYLVYLKDRTDELLTKSYKKTFTDLEIKDKLIKPEKSSK